MIEYRCPACQKLAYSAAGASHAGGCPSCGTPLEVAATARSSYTSPGQMNASVRAANARQTANA
jgi:hypothetical protein